MRFLFATLQHIESDFYGRVGAELAGRGHEAVFVSYSRRAARVLARKGFRSYCLPDRMALLDERLQLEALAVRIERDYETPSLRDVYRTDLACDGRPEDWCVERTVRHFLALERIFDEEQPDAVIPEVGNETIRTATHLIAMGRGVPVLLLGYTIFPRPLRLCADTLQQPLVRDEELRPLEPHEEEELDAFIADFKARAAPIRAYHDRPITLTRARILARHLAVRLVYDRDNDYLRPLHWSLGLFAEKVRRRLLRPLYGRPEPARPFVYFPLQVTHDYKITRLVPHCANQLWVIEQVARALPHGVDLVVKEHPMAVGRDQQGFLWRLCKMRNVRLVDPYTSSHELIARARAVVVISSTVGLEALLYGKPVLTLGHPHYAGFGVTVDLASFEEIRHLVPAVLDFRPDRERARRLLHAGMRHCFPGAPVLVDRSDANAQVLATSLDEAVRDVDTLRTLPVTPRAIEAQPTPIDARQRPGP